MFVALPNPPGQDIYWDGEKGRNDCGVRTHGLTTTTTAVLIGLCAKDGTLTAQGKKDAHKVCAGAWGAFAGLHGYHVYTVRSVSLALCWWNEGTQGSRL